MIFIEGNGDGALVRDGRGLAFLRLVLVTRVKLETEESFVRTGP